MAFGSENQPTNNTMTTEVPSHGSESPKVEQEFPQLSRQSSLYSLTSDEFQASICEPGKNFGSTNTDEFVSNIWNVQEEHAMITAVEETPRPENLNGCLKNVKPLTGQSSLPRHGSLTIPTSLCMKTVEEVWIEMQQNQQQHQQEDPNGGSSENAHRQPSFGEMTLEDFLIKVGVVRDSNRTSVVSFPYHFQQQPQSQQPQQPFGYVQNNNKMEGGPSFTNVVGHTFPDYPPPSEPYQSQQQQQQGVDGFSNFDGMKMVNAEMMNTVLGSGGARPSHGGMENSVSQCGIEKGSGSGRKLMVDVAIERRQRRMIKNRESAARSRARKQAYTVELEAELVRLKEENAQLKKETEELEDERRKEIVEIIQRKRKNEDPPEESELTKKVKRLRRTMSSPF